MRLGVMKDSTELRKFSASQIPFKFNQWVLYLGNRGHQYSALLLPAIGSVLYGKEK